jgi:catechol 2,3-dioxygenase-like lactoylglutathione lyase family enzyme
MSSVQIEQKSYEMPPRDGFTVTDFITVADIDRSADFYERVFGGRILSRGDSKGASGHIQIANTWLIVSVGGGPTPDKPTVTLSIPADPDKIPICDPFTRSRRSSAWPRQYQSRIS